MSYVVGISSGAFGLVDQKEKQNLMTITRKIFAGGLEGVNFTQVDLEAITEFNEPNVKENLRKIKDLGITFGFHGEFYGGSERPLEMLDSAIEADYYHSHDRLVRHIEGCGDLGGKYVNFHPSQTTPFIRLGKDLQPTKLVDPWGRPMKKFLEENKWLKDWIMEEDNEFLWEFMHTTPKIAIKSWLRDEVNDYKKQYGGKEPSEGEKEKLKKEVIERLKEAFINRISTSDLSYGPERVAYYIIAKWMQKNNDSLWNSIVGEKIKDKDLTKRDNFQKWVPAVSAKYILGHFQPKNGLDNPSKLMEKHKIYCIFECEMGRGGTQGMSRIIRPRDFIFLCQAIKSKWAAVCIDFEHVLSQNIDPKKEIESFPPGAAERVKLLHLGFPTPHVPAHMPIPLGSKEQLWIYERLYELRQKGMDDAWMIFERAGNPREQVILVLRLIKQFLEKGIAPKELPLEFYGIRPDGPEMRRQELAVREHALDPLKGLFSVPEEEYTFLGTAAKNKGKAELWGKERFK
ncbi:MAG: hypothetical protein JW700_01205 [Candidatus Aenigmarchaeota archaeon]|nr:hypothetical protein [Candidatus Aenigmarchaeota archaeon]